MEKPILWYQGLFLQPQHLQMKDRYNHELLSPYHKYTHPYLWGVENLKIRKNDLSNRSIYIEKGQFWFSDKTYACLDENAVIEPRSFKDSMFEDGKPLTVYIGLKKYNEKGGNVTTLSQGAEYYDVHTRFISTLETEEVKDQYGQGAPGQIKRMSLLLKIFFESEIENLGNYELLPAMSVQQDSDNIIQTPGYISPCFSLNGSSNLMGYINDISGQLMSRSNMLESYKSERGVHNAEFGSRDMVYLLALRSINRYIPILDHMVKSDVHPWQIYGLLRQVTGELSTFTEKLNVMGDDPDGNSLLPAYDHKELTECFSKASSLVSLLLDEITAGPKYIIPVKFDDTYYSAFLEPAYFNATNRYYMVIRTETEPKKVLEDIRISLKTGAKEIMPVLIRQSLPGVKLSHLKNPPQELPRRAHTLYFLLDSHGDIWSKIDDKNNIAISWDSAPQDVKIELMIIG